MNDEEDVSAVPLIVYSLIAVVAAGLVVLWLWSMKQARLQEDARREAEKTAMVARAPPPNTANRVPAVVGPRGVRRRDEPRQTSLRPAGPSSQAGVAGAPVSPVCANAAGRYDREPSEGNRRVYLSSCGYTPPEPEEGHRFEMTDQHGRLDSNP